MKVIGKIDRDKYICEVSHYELEKYLNQYYNKIERLNVNDSVDLGKGYYFLGETKDCLKKTQEFIQSNKRIIESILTGIETVGKGEVK